MQSVLDEKVTMQHNVILIVENRGETIICGKRKNKQ